MAAGRTIKKNSVKGIMLPIVSLLLLIVFAADQRTLPFSLESSVKRNDQNENNLEISNRRLPFIINAETALKRLTVRESREKRQQTHHSATLLEATVNAPINRGRVSLSSSISPLYHFRSIAFVDGRAPPRIV